MDEPLRIGLVGCGRLAEVGYVPALQAAQGMHLAAIVDPAPDRRAGVAALAGDVPAFRDTAALLTGTPVDGLVLATPASAHFADARAAARAGIPALVEKPPALDGNTASELAGLAPEPRIGFNRRFDPAVRRLRAAHTPATAADTGLELRLELCYRRSGWGALTVTDDALLDLGPHLIDLARWISGGEVSAVRRAAVTDGRATFDLELGPARARIRCATNRPHHELVELRDARGRVLDRNRRGGLPAAVLGRLPRRRRGPHPLVASLVAQLEAFGRAVRGAAEPELGRAADGWAVMRVVDAVRGAAGQNTTVALSTKE